MPQIARTLGWPAELSSLVAPRALIIWLRDFRVLGLGFRVLGF